MRYYDKSYSNGFAIRVLIGLLLLLIGRSGGNRYPGYTGPVPPRLQPGFPKPPFA